MSFRNQRGHLLAQLPAFCSFNAVSDRKMFPLLRIQIILRVSIPCRVNIIRRIRLDLADNRRDNRLRFLCPKCTIYKVILHINDDQNPSHFNLLCLRNYTCHLTAFVYYIRFRRFRTDQPHEMMSGRLHKKRRRIFPAADVFRLLGLPA